VIQQGKNKAQLIWNDEFATNRTKGFERVQVYVDNKVLRKCDPYVPMDTGTLKKSGILGTVVGSGEVVYNAPYARKQYYTNKGNGNHNKSGLRGSYWFERMKNDHKRDILDGARKIAGCK
jgi:hypothetical protein